MEGPEKRLFPKDIAIPSGSRKSVPEKKMRGRKSNASKKKDSGAGAATESESKEDVVFAVKSIPPSVETPKPKTVRAYGRKSAAQKLSEAREKKMPVLAADADDPEAETQRISTEEKMPILNKPEETTSGRSVRNKRKKEVFDPSDIVPKKRQSLTAPPPIKEKPTPPPAKITKTPPPVVAKKGVGRKKKVEPEPETGIIIVTSFF